MKYFLLAAMAVALVGCKEDPEWEQWRGVTVVKICRDGTRILHRKDGTFWTNVPHIKVENPQTVCEAS